MKTVLKTFSIVAATAALAGFAADSTAQLLITTADGNGADTYLINDQGPGTGVAQGGSDFMELRQLPDVRTRIPYFRFDLSGVTGDLSGATITINGENVNRNRPLAIYGLNDGATGGQGENWDESTLLYSDAAGFDPAADGQFAFSSDMTASRIARTAGSAVGPNITELSVDLDNFLAADTDGLVTFAVILEEVVNGSEDFFFYTKESLDGNTGAPLGLEPVLTLPNIPEPASAALLGLGGLAMLRRRSA